MKLIIITGTFGYKKLISKIIENRNVLLQKYSEIVLQCGGSFKDFKSFPELTFIDYYENIFSFIEGASLVVSHAGTGTLLEIAKGNVPFILVPNEDLKDNHQKELSYLLGDKYFSSINCIVVDIINFSNKKLGIRRTNSIWGILKESLK
ncbi:beta-1,4-N-acetylglucosaminyltransferase [Nematocida sp. LUAm3]|nr:beta-1,4-N-acetylglucosaminyltransferase [Nematocida sp. LUAm3]KAI5174608.1 beta-1,4-N-acetylglucosaminyltransferase [Nematocida sp. LUAm2]KAI5177986.1 beta-1,4-N-acetylglucosaminyltransferase [Nematocida sp. LUAm1]